MTANTVLRDMPLVMRDGTALYMDVYLPEAQGRFPVLLNRTPYLKDRMSADEGYAPISKLTASGYAVVIQDVRGTGRSEGECDPVAAQDEDGYDTVEALAGMPFCTGEVGMYGESCNGFTQLACARANPPHLIGVCPFQTSWTKFPAAYDFGVFSPVIYLWSYGRCRERLRYYPQQYSEETLRLLDEYENDMPRQAAWRPMCDMPAALVKGVPELRHQRALLANIDQEAYLTAVGRADGSSLVTVPALCLTGWHDFLRDKAIETFLQFQANGGSAACRTGARLIVGPWMHGNVLSRVVDGVDFGPDASGEAFDVSGKIIAFYDAATRRRESGFMRSLPVWLFIMGKNIWRNEAQWPLERTAYTPYYLARGGTLSPVKPQDTQADSFLSDPLDPCPSGTGDKKHWVLQDQRVNEAREDVLVYTTRPFDRETELTGPINVTLFASCDCVCADFVVKCCLVLTNGASLPLGMKLVRARYRNGRSAQYLTPGKIERYDILAANTALVVSPGQRIRIDVTGSLFPDADVNLHTAGAIGTQTEGRAARQTVYFGGEYPSRVVLPIIA